MFNIDSHNPDVLTCIANLSSDEVFTPPQLVNQILDLLPPDLWQNKNTRFLDPCCKSGVFLREIAKRLEKGLKVQIPHPQKRMNHIFKRQLFGLPITELTALLTRRSVYCSKTANGKYSICEIFKNSEGNIRFKPMDHDWKNGRCLSCSANEANYKRSLELETHAYQFIHTKNLKELFKMKFDVIIGNPPYQLSDGGNAASAIPIYHKFVRQAKLLNPRYLSMIIPARWYTGGRGLDDFREEMIQDERIRVLHDFTNASDCFPGVEIKGGVCFFLWDRDNNGLCRTFTHKANGVVTEAIRPLQEKGLEIFVRHSKLLSILKKVQSKNENPFSNIVSANDPFGFDVREKNSYRRVKAKFKKRKFAGSVLFYFNGWRKDGIGHISRTSARKGNNLIDAVKILVPRVWGIGDSTKDRVPPFIPKSPSCNTETYLVIGPFKQPHTADNVISYMQTKFFHAMVSLVKNTQQAMKKVYSFVPMQNFIEPSTDEKLYKKYGLTKDEINFIETMIRPVETNGE
jgi:site-specific DNA-methyltransferase (adenine-specific)